MECDFLLFIRRADKKGPAGELLAAPTIPVILFKYCVYFPTVKMVYYLIRDFQLFTGRDSRF